MFGQYIQNHCVFATHCEWNLSKAFLCLPSCEIFSEILLEMAGSSACWDCLKDLSYFGSSENCTNALAKCANKLPHFMDKFCAKSVTYPCLAYRGVVGQERVGTAFPYLFHVLL